MNKHFTAYLRSVNETCLEHFAFTLRFGVKMILGNIAAIMHTVVPFLSVTSVGNIRDEMQAMRQNSPRRKKLS